MMYLPASVRVYLCASACDMRKSFDGLHALVTQSMELDAFAGHLFVFANRRRDRIKILYWDRDGFAVWAKRLEEGTYAMPFGDTAEKRREITAAELGALLSACAGLLLGACFGSQWQILYQELPANRRKCRADRYFCASVPKLFLHFFTRGPFLAL
jgi:transposase